MLFRLVDQAIGLVAQVNAFPLLLVGSGILFGILHHAIHLLVVQGGRSRNGNGLLLAAAFVPGGDVQNAVGVNVEGHLDLGNATGRRGDALQLEGAQALVVLGHLPLTLEHMDFHVGLAIHRRGVHLLLLGGNGGVAVNHPGHHAAQGFHPEGQGRHVQQKDVFHVTGQHATLNGGADGHHLVGVHRLVGFLAGHLLHQILHSGDAGGATHHHHLVQFACRKLGIGKGPLHRRAAAVNQMAGEFLEAGPGDGHVQVLGTVLGGGDKRQVDLALGGAGEFDFRLLGRLREPLQGLFVLTQVNPFFRLERIGQVIHDHLVKVVTAQMGVSACRQHLKHPIPHFQHRDVKGAAAQIKHQDALVALLVQAIG